MISADGQLRHVGSSTVSRVKEGPLSLLDSRVNTDNSGATSVNAAITAAKALLPARGGNMYAPPGLYRLTENVELTLAQQLSGAGFTSNAGAANRAATCFLKQGAFDAFTLRGEAALKNLQVDGDTGNTGDGIYITGARAVLEDVTVTSQGGSGVRVGGKTTGLNANLVRIRHLITLNNAEHGLYIHDVSSSTLPIANAGLLEGLDARSNGGDGLRAQHSIDWEYLGVHVASNTGWGINLLLGAEGHAFLMPYTEANVAGEGQMQAGSRDNLVWGCRSNIVGDGWTDAGTNNLILGRDNNTTRWTTQGSMDFRTARVTSDLISGAWELRQNATTRALEVVFIDSGASPVDVSWTHNGAGAVRQRFGQVGFNDATPVAKSTGWAAATGTATKTTFDTATVTTAELAQRVKALLDYLTTRGDIGA